MLGARLQVQGYRGVAGMCPAQGVADKTAGNEVTEDLGAKGLSPPKT